MIPFNKPFIAGKELYYISQSVIRGHLSGDGYYTKLCHQWLEDHLHCNKAFLMHSCTAALEMAAILCDIQPGDEVIMPSFTFVSTANAFVLRGGIPVFIDIHQETLNINEKLIEDAVTSRTKAICAMHYAGVPCAMEEILSIAAKNNLLVIEDAAQALLSTYKGKYLGTIGHLGCLSFHETKNIISGEGGALLINDERFIERTEIIREKGTNRNKFFRGEVDKYTWVDVGSSYLPSELIGAFLYAQLEQAEKIIGTRKDLFQRYYETLKPLEAKGYIRLPFIGEGYEANGHIFYILCRSLKERTGLIRLLRDLEIHAVFHYIPLHSSPAGLKYGRVSSGMTMTDDVSDRLLRLPLYYEMTDEEIGRVCEAVQDYFSAL